jgi:8-oxo-dGTP diphosphatase
MASSALPRPRVGVGVALVSPDGRALLVGRRLGSHGAARWAFPGGHLEGGEAWDACAARETAEETGVALPPARFRLAGVTNDVMAGEGLHYVTLFMAATTCRVVNAEPHKCAGWEWVPLPQLRADDPARPLFTSLRNFLDGAPAVQPLERLMAAAAGDAGESVG